jgi:putative acetyltransferase
MLLREEHPGDREQVRALHLRAFGDEGLLVADLVDSLRDTVESGNGLSLVAERDGRIAGHVMFTRSLLDAPGGWWRCRSSAPWPCCPSSIGKASARLWSGTD